jgi:hypothetical protein
LKGRVIAYCIREDVAEFALIFHSWERKELHTQYEDKPGWKGYLVLNVIKNDLKEMGSDSVG